MDSSSSSSSSQVPNQTLPVVDNQQQQQQSQPSSASSSSYQRNKPQRLNKFQGNRVNRPANDGARNDSVASSSSSSASSQLTLKADNGAQAADLESAEPAMTAAASVNDSGNKKKKQFGKPSQGKSNSYGGQRGGYQNKANNRHHMIDSEAVSSPASNGFRSGNGSKKTNLNHLLNFTYESMRDSGENYYEYERMTKQFWSTKLAKNSYFSKEQFLQAK